MLDLHAHVWEHHPGTPTPTYELLARYCERANRAGIEQIAITEHSHRFAEVAAVGLPLWRRNDDPRLMAATDHVWRQEGGASLDAYVDALVSAQDRGLPLLVGLEVDWLPGANEGITKLLDPYPFDVLLGSVHWLGSWLFDAYGDATFAAEWASRDTGSVWTAYADAVIDLVQSGHVDVIAHLDVIKVAGHRPHDVETFESRLCDALTASDTVVEISTAGWRKPADELYPSPDMLRKLHEHGVAVTTASDAHRADQIGYRFGDLRRELGDVGIDVLTTFRRRRASTVRLP